MASSTGGGLRLGASIILAGAGKFLARFFGLTLAIPHAGIKAIRCQQRIVRAALDDLALVQHDDFVSPHDGREPMRDHQRGAIARNTLERVLDFLFRMAVERRRRLIEHQNGGAFEDRARDGHPLLLATR